MLLLLLLLHCCFAAAATIPHAPAAAVSSPAAAAAALLFNPCGTQGVNNSSNNRSKRIVEWPGDSCGNEKGSSTRTGCKVTSCLLPSLQQQQDWLQGHFVSSPVAPATATAAAPTAAAAEEAAAGAAAALVSRVSQVYIHPPLPPTQSLIQSFSRCCSSNRRRS